MLKNTGRRLTAIYLMLALVVGMLPVVAPPVSAAGITGMPADCGLTSDIAGTDGATWSIASADPLNIYGKITGKGTCGKGGTSRETTLTLTNNTGVPVNITFSYSGVMENDGILRLSTTQEQVKEFAGRSDKQSSMNISDSFDKELAANEQIIIYMRSGASQNSDTEITFSNITVTVLQSNDITFRAPVGGSITVNGSAVTEDTEVSQLEIPVTATPSAGYLFLGWLD